MHSVLDESHTKKMQASSGWIGEQSAALCIDPSRAQNPATEED
jgi:hypothetical protein